jgi:hypothetical protein
VHIHLWKGNDNSRITERSVYLLVQFTQSLQAIFEFTEEAAG